MTKSIITLWALITVALFTVIQGCAQVEYDPHTGKFTKRETVIYPVMKRHAVLLAKDGKAAKEKRIPGSVASFADDPDGMSCSYIAAILHALEYRGIETDYNWLCGVSGEVFRFQYKPGWNAFSSDPTVGYGLSPYLFDAMGLCWRIMDAGAERHHSPKKMLNAVEESVRQDYPVIALGLDSTAEWGIITGIANPATAIKGSGLLCRNFFDQHRSETGYSIAKEFPWTILLFRECGDRPPEEDSALRSILLACDMNSTGSTGDYLLGVNGLRAWIDDLRMNIPGKIYPDSLIDAEFANAWLLRRLRDDRVQAAKYLRRITVYFAEGYEELEEAANLYDDESILLEHACNDAPYPWKSEKTWSNEQRERQIHALESIIMDEERITELLGEVCRLIGGESKN